MEEVPLKALEQILEIMTFYKRKVGYIRKDEETGKWYFFDAYVEGSASVTIEDIKQGIENARKSN